MHWSAMERLLADAIRDRRVVEFVYHGEVRQVEPYLLGGVAHTLRLKGWQIRKGWRTFRVQEIESLEATDRHFDEPREGFAPDPNVTPVIASIS